MTYKHRKMIFILNQKMIDRFFHKTDDESMDIVTSLPSLETGWTLHERKDCPKAVIANRVPTSWKANLLFGIIEQFA